MGGELEVYCDGDTGHAGHFVGETVCLQEQFAPRVPDRL
jgi:hypothetical protein